MHVRRLQEFSESEDLVRQTKKHELLLWIFFFFWKLVELLELLELTEFISESIWILN